uniref:PEP-CTERM sorting domain-containing protein n=1 Tax=Sedimenticola hydrogenitrophicus TaxID=2967975 RepID=UPI0023B044D5
SVADLVDAVNFTGVPLGGELFSGLSLVADTYYVVIENTGLLSIIWEGGDNPIVSAMAGVHHLDDWTSTVFDPTFPPISEFDVVLGQGARFYSISTTTIGSVPEPGSIALFILGATLISFARCHKKSRMLA